ncbi:S24/S26 family peptidase [Knoellia flava]|uniref:S24/S26 family peptidase n=1 Tax=Knoellia flava TaxID=913969 RepID=UPI000A47911F|nr:S24/S26 family peptidase [Knoellia flava]
MSRPRLPRPRLVRVSGRSMEPTLHEGDVLLALWGARVEAGDVAVVRLPNDSWGRPRPLSVKRVTGTDPGDPTRWWLDSDNPREGVTSFDVGSIAEEDVVAVVRARLRPRPRRVGGRHTPAR